MQQIENTGAAGIAADENQYLTFRLGEEEFGIEILRVQEIKGWVPVTPIPNAPPWLKGVMNLRGTVVPVVDLRLKFGLSQSDYTRFTVVIVVTLGERVIGLVVDAVSDVLDISASDVVPPPEVGGMVDTGFLAGLAKSGDRIISLLAVEPLVGDLTGKAAA